MSLNLVDGMFGEVFVDFCHHAGLHVAVEGLAQFGQSARRRRNDHRLHFAFAHQFLERIGDQTGKAMFFELMPIGWLYRAAAVWGGWTRE
jgi:hypothetical protein